MKTTRLLDVILRASLLAVPVAACTCPDGTVDATGYASRAELAAQIDACLADDARCEALCRQALELAPESSVHRCIVTMADKLGASLEVTYTEPVDCSAGRRPDGLVEPRCRPRAAGAWLARVATVEAASVTSFVRLVHALERLAAPRSLIAAARRAIADELVHARLVTRLARRLGGSPEPPVIAEVEPASLEQLARDNAIEGQVAETFGALVAACQARAATDPEVRATFVRIARDEARHAALAHRLAPWLERQLDVRARAGVASARREAAAAIADRVKFGLTDSDRATLGIPDAARLRVSAAQVFAELAR